jgi:hypothetical protein
MKNTLDTLRKMMTKEGKAEVLTLFGKYIESAEAIANGIDQVKPSIDEIHDTAGKLMQMVDNPTLSRNTKNIAKQLSTLLKIQKQQQVYLANVAAILTVYLASDSFTTDVAHTMNKLGHGEEALQAMLKSKFEGKL